MEKAHKDFLKTVYRNTALASAALAVLLLSGCAGMEERLSRVGVEPPLSAIKNPTQQKGYKPLSFPMPEEQVAQSSPNSLWQQHRQAFFKDQRANKVGDILTVLIDIDDEADMKNKTQRTRQNDETQGLPHLLGLEKLPAKILPGGYDPSNLVSMGSDSTSTGDGTLKREETIKLKLAAMIMQVLPNGNFVIKGNQEVRVNYELRQLTLAGVIRPEDILNNNSISYDKVAEARISYGGKGTMSDIQTPRYGDQILDAIFPF